MRIQDFKRWHWIVISLLVGAALGYSRLQMDPGESVTRSPSMGTERFEHDVRNRPDSGRPFLENIVIYPVEEIIRNGKPAESINVVEFDLVVPAEDGTGVATRYNVKFPFPYKPVGRRGAAIEMGEESGIADYLDRLKENLDHVTYRNAWWVTPRNVYAMCIGGSFVVIGLVWPTLIHLLTGAGFSGGQKSRDEYDLDRFGKGGEVAAAGAVGMSEEDQARLAAVEAGLEASLKNSDIAMTDQPPPPQEAPIRELNASAVETLSPPPPTEEAAKDFKGEFYPVARSKGKTD